MRERSKHFHRPESKPSLIRHARAYKIDPSLSNGEEWIIGYGEFSGSKGTESEALDAAVKQIAPNTHTHLEATRRYRFISLPTETSERVKALLEGWGYSAKNTIDYVKRSLYSQNSSSEVQR